MSVDAMVDKFGTGAVRSGDADDVRYDLISPIALEEIAKTYKEGAERYGDHNWLKGFPVSDLLNHALRHVYLFLSGDRSEPHLPHAAWGLMAAIHSHKQWPHLNGNLLGPGCVPPSNEPVECGSQLPCDDPAGCQFRPDCDGDWAIFEYEKATAEPASPGGQDAPLPPGIARYPDHDSFSGVQSSHWGIGASTKRDDFSHHIPVIEDALNGRGPFPVLYLSGPMSGYRDLNFPAFNNAAEKLRQIGFPVLNPADFGAHGGLSWEENLHRDLGYLGHADILVQLPGWADSRGASLEFNTAVALGKGVTSVHTLLPN